MRANLHFRKAGHGSKSLCILHGLFGSADNWQSLGKDFAEAYTVYFIDLRNHGRSEHQLVHTYEAMAEDLEQLLNQEGIEKAIVLGHSMGGKTAMRFAQMFESRVEKLVVADMGIKEYLPHHQAILEALNSFNPEKIESRSEAETQLRKYISEEGVVQFLLKNLYRLKPQGYAWRFNLPILESSMPDILEEIPAIEVSVPTLFIRGEKSNYILDEDFPSILKLFPQAVFDTVSNAGHWLHAENPDEFFAKVSNFLESAP